MDGWRHSIDSASADVFRALTGFNTKWQHMQQSVGDMQVATRWPLGACLAQPECADSHHTAKLVR